MAKKINFSKFEQRLQKEKSQLPKVLGNIALRHFRQGFRKGGFTDKAFKPWKPRKHPNAADTRTGKKRGLLIDSGNLRGSLRVKTANFRRIRVGSYGIEYATIHNEGGTTHPKVTPRMRGFMRHQFKKTGNPLFNAIANTKKTSLTVPIPQRKYIGVSVALRKKLEKRILKEIKSIFG